MNQAQSQISYDQYMPQPIKQRINIFNEISAENRALLVKTHVERWLEINRQQLRKEQIEMVQEMLRFITPEKYETGIDMGEVDQEIKDLQRKAETVFSRDQLRQIFSERADYVPPVDA
jgi:hypothetical protein